MKKSRRIISIILSLIMVMQILPVFATEATVAEVRVNPVEGRIFEVGKAIEFKVTEANGAEVSDAIVDTVTLGVEAEKSYKDGILTITPAEGEVKEGDTIYVYFADNDYVKFGDNKKTFAFTAREYGTGTILNNQFNTAGNTEGWVANSSKTLTVNDGVTLSDTIAIVENPIIDGKTYEGSVLKLSSNANNISDGYGANDAQIWAFNQLDKCYRFEEGKTITIKTKIYQEAATATQTGRFDLRFNRPNAATVTGRNDNQWINYGILRQDGNETALVSSITAGTSSNPNYYSLDKKLTGLEPSNQWIEYTITLDGVAGTSKVVAVDEAGKSYTNTGKFGYSDVICEYFYGNGATMAEYGNPRVLESLTFKNTSAEPVYIDYIKVYEATISNVRVNPVEGRTFEVGKAIEFKVTEANGAEVSDAIVDTVTIGIEAEKSYKDGILTIKPAEGEVKEGDIIYVYFADNDYVKFGDNKKTFAFTAREYGTGTILNNQFNTAGNTEGWVANSSKNLTVNEGVTLSDTIAIVENPTIGGKTYEGSVLKLSSNANNINDTNGAQIWAFNQFDKCYRFEEGKKLTIKTKVYQEAATANTTGRFDLRFNRPNAATVTGRNDNQWINYGILRQDDNEAALVSGITSGTSSNPNYYGLDKKLTGLASSNQWIEYTITLDGVAGTSKVVAVDEAGNTYTNTGKFGYSDEICEYFYGNGATMAEYGNPRVLESLTFKNTSAEPVYIDYIEVYEVIAAEVRVNPVEGRTFEVGKAIEFKVTEANGAEVSDAIVDTVTLGVEAEKSYKDGILTITPAEGEVKEGDIIYVYFADNDYVKFGDNKKTFAFTAREYGTGSILNNQFNTAGNTEGWVANSSKTLTVNEGVTLSDTIAIVENPTIGGKTYEGSVLKLSSNANNINDTNGAQIWAFNQFDKCYRFEEGKKLTIKTKVYQEAATANTTGRFDLRFNRPNAATVTGPNDNQWINYGILRQDDNEAALVSGITAGTSSSPNYYSLDKKLAGLEPSNQWVEYTIILDGVAGTSKVVATDEAGNTYSNTGKFGYSDVICEYFYGNGATMAEYGNPRVLESLTFKNTSAEPVYIDYVEVYETSYATVTIDAAAMPGYDVKIKGNADICAYIHTGKDMPENITDLVDLYNGENVVEVTKTHIEDTNKVVIDPKSDLPEGAYTVKFNKNALSAQGYEVEGQTEFTVNVADGANVDMNFEDETAGAFTDTTWAFDENAEGTNRAATIVEENDNKFLRITANGKLSVSNMNTMINYSKTLDTPFIRDMKASTVFEVRIRTSADNVRKLIKFNNPDEGNRAVNAYGEIGWNTRVAAVMDNGNIGVAYKDFGELGDGSEKRQGNPQTITTYDVAEWYTIKTIYHNSKGTASTYIYDEEGKLVGLKENQPLAAWWFNFYDYNETQPQVMHSIDDITIRFRPESTIELTSDEVFDIDDIKLYNLTEVSESATAKFMSGEDEITSIDENVTNVTPTFAIQSKDNTTADYYIIAAVYEDGRLIGNQMKKVTVEGATVEPLTLDEITVDYTKAGLVVKAFVWNTDMVPVCEATQINPKVNTIYMATYGNDSNMGYESAPVATLNRAIELANDAKTRGYSTSEVIVADGTYELTGQTISIGSKLTADSLTVRAENAGKAQFINGVAFEISEATLVNDTVDANAVFGRLAHQGEDAVNALRENLYVIDLNDKLPAGAKIPDMNLIGTYSYFCTLKQGNGSSAITMANGEKYNVEESTSPTSELFFKGKPLTLARYPDVDAANPYATIGEVEMLGTTTTPSSESFDLSGGNKYTKRSITRNWMNDNKGKDDYVEEEYRVDDPFTVTLDRATNWADADQAYMFGFWVYDWATQAVAVKDINTTTGVITSKYPSHYGLKTGQRFYVYNLLEEISQPGEYFIDRNTGLMYFYKPAGAELTDEITLSLYGGTIFDITASNVTIKDLVIGASRGSAVYASGNNVKIENCDISGTGDRAVTLSGTNSVISNCNIHDVNGGILLDAGNTDTLTSGNSKALNNTITNFSRLNKTYTAAIGVSGMGNTASYNIISDGEHLAMRLSGVDNEVSYNDISKVLKEADDMGAIYYGRSWTSRDNVIKFNYIHDLHSTQVGANDSSIGAIFLDDHTADFEIYGNIFYDIDGHGVRLNKGREHKINNNIFGKLEYPVSGSQASGNANDYTTQIDDVKALLNKDAWKNSIYASELFNVDKTDYNPDLLWSKGLEFKNNFTAASDSDTVEGTWSNANTQFTIEGNASLTNMPTTKASITSSVTTAGGAFDFTGFDANFLKAIGITE